MTLSRVALVTGANRGIGFEICRQLAAAGLTAVVSGRHEAKTRRAAEALIAKGHEVRHVQLDVTDADSRRRALAFIEGELGRLDVLVNNAAIAVDRRLSILDMEMEVVRQTFEVNYFGPLSLCRASIPLMKNHDYGRIVNVSSGRASFTRLAADGPAYRMSKTTLNAFTRVLAAELEEAPILVNAMTPGWVRTRLTGPNAPLSVAQGADTAVWLATLPDDGPRGQFFKNREVFPW